MDLYSPREDEFINMFKEMAPLEKEIILYDNVLRDSDKGQKALFNYLCGYRSFIKLNGSRHMIFTDYPIIKGEKMESENLSVEKAHEVINDITIRFLDEFLCGKVGQYSRFIASILLIVWFSPGEIYILVKDAKTHEYVIEPHVETNPTIRMEGQPGTGGGGSFVFSISTPKSVTFKVSAERYETKTVTFFLFNWRTYTIYLD